MNKRIILALLCWPYFSWAKITPQIVNGTTASDFDAVAWSTVALQMPSIEDGKTVYSHCTAFIIGYNMLMTAAHCLNYLTDKSPVEAIFTLAPKYGPDDGTQKRIGLSDFRINPNYYGDDTGVYNDIAIIKLKEDIPWGYQPLALDWNLDSSLEAGDSLIVAGYGATTDFNVPDPQPPLLRFATIPFVGGDKSPFQISDQLLADQTNSGFCSGDSGGPLFVNEGFFLAPVGIVSHVTQNSQGQWSCKAEGAFTRIAYFKEWIEQSLAELQ